jgi:hypothetical protein
MSFRRVAAMVSIGLVGVTMPALMPARASAGPVRWATCGRFVEIAAFEEPGAYLTLLSDVARVSTHDAWAVGESIAESQEALVLRWDGWRWTRVALPRSGRPEALMGIAVVADGDVWAVGSRGEHPLSLHWDGRSWTRVPQPRGVRGWLTSVASIPGTRRLWAVGASGDGGALIERWNGRNWRVVATPPRLRDRGPLQDVVAFRRVAFAVGHGLGAGALAIRWNGERWYPVSVPHRTDTMLSGIDGIGPSKVWAVGGRLDRAVVLRWDHGWSTVRWLRPSSGLQDVAVAAPDVVWAVGAGTHGPIVLRRTSGSWTLDPRPRTDLPSFGSLSAVDGTPHDLWATGNGGNPEIPAVLLHRC